MSASLLDASALLGNKRIAYSDSGSSAEGMPVILIHGTPSHSYIWRDVAPALTAAGHRVLTFDLLGFGCSERPREADTSVAAQGGVLRALLDERGIDRAHVVGHDIGGAVALRFAIRHPEYLRTLTLIDTVSYDSWPSRTWREIIDRHLSEYAALPAEEFREMMARQLRMTVYDKQRMSGAVLEAYLEPVSGPVGQTSFFEHQVSHYDSRYTEEISGKLREISAPVNILWGEEDEWQPVSYARRLRSDIPDSRLTVISEAGHFLMEDAPERVSEEMLSFIREAEMHEGGSAK